MKTAFLSLACVTLLAACQSSAPYTPPEDSGLSPLRPYPTDADVCQIIQPTDVVKSYVQKNSTLIACPNHEIGAIEDRQAEGATVVGQQSAWTILRLGAASAQPTGYLTAPTDALPKALAGNTSVHYDSFHGTQVEYRQADGQVYLWYPTNTRSLAGQAKTQTTNGQTEICHRYKSAGINPATGVVGYAWECAPLSSNLRSITHMLQGDPFDLASGQIPFVLKKRKKMSLSALLSGANLSASEVTQIAR